MLFFFAVSLAGELQRVSDRGDVSSFRSLLSEHLLLLHPNHYLLLLLKRHIVVLTSDQFRDMTVNELQEIKAMCEEVQETVCNLKQFLNFLGTFQ